MDASNEPWTSLVKCGDSAVSHGRDPKNLDFTLCGGIPVDASNLYRGAFYGNGSRDCSVCAELLQDNHY